MGRGIFLHLSLHTLEEEEPNDVVFGFDPPPPKIRSFSEAIQSLEDVKAFLDAKGNSEQATVVASAVDMVASLNCSSLASGRQSTLDEYFRFLQNFIGIIYTISVIIVFNYY